MMVTRRRRKIDLPSRVHHRSDNPRPVEAVPVDDTGAGGTSEGTGGAGIAPGVAVRCHLIGRRSFPATVLKVREDGSVDLADPKNGGLRTVRPETISVVKRKRRSGE